MPSAAAQVLVTVIPIVGIVTGGVVIFFYLLWYFQEKKLLIEKGQFKKKEFDLNTFSLFSGLVLFFVGVSLVIFFVIIDGFSYSALGGVLPLSLGLSLLLFFIIRLKMNKNRNDK